MPDAHGIPALKRDSANQAILASASILALSSLAFSAQAQTSAEASRPDQSVATVDEIIVTGTRATGRTVANSASPIDVISGDAVVNTGAPNVLEALNLLLPSFNLPAQVQPDLGALVRGAQLRGLDPAYTLVLVNGKRRHTTAVVNYDGFAGSVPVDLALIPGDSIERIEVLRDGASAVYGSDAIAGVINIILKSGAQPSTLSVQAGATYEGDGAVYIARGTHGWSFADGRGYLNLGAEAIIQERAVRNPEIRSSYLYYPAIDRITGLPVRLGPNNSLPAGADPDPREATRDPQIWKNQGRHATDTYSLSANLGYEIDANTEFYAFGTYAHRKGDDTINYRLPNTVFINNPGGLSVYPDGFQPLEVIDEDDLQITGGLRGQIGDWRYDFSSSYGRDHLDVFSKNALNYSLAYPGAQTDFYVGARTYSAWLNNLDLSRTFQVGEREIDVAVGAQYQHENNKLKAGEPNSYFGVGVSGLIGYRPDDAVDVSRDSYAVYGAVSTYLTPKWFVDVAGRAEHYSDFGESYTGKLSTRYDFTPSFAVRATVSNGFHAPSLVAASYSNTNDQAGVLNGLVQPDSAAALALGSTPLKPEEATNYTLGVTSRLGGWRFAVDAYQIEVDHRLNTSPNIGINRSSGVPVDGSGRTLTNAQATLIDNLLQSAGYAAGTNIIVRYFTDVGDTRTRGVDITAEANTDLGAYGRVRWNFALNFNKTDLTRISAVPSQLAQLPNIEVLSLANQYAFKYRAPEDKQVVNVNWSNGPWGVNLQATRFGELIRNNSVTGGEYTLGDSVVTNLSVGYDIREGLRLTAGANNLFNVTPDKVPDEARNAASRAQYDWTWDYSSPVGLLGGQYFVRLDYRF